MDGWGDAVKYEQSFETLPFGHWRVGKVFTQIAIPFSSSNLWAEQISHVKIYHFGPRGSS